jgi:hypothetical protein
MPWRRSRKVLLFDPSHGSLGGLLSILLENTEVISEDSDLPRKLN